MNRRFPQIWEQPRPVHPMPPFGNQQPNFYQNSPQNFQNNFRNNFPQNIRPSNHHDQQGPNVNNPPPGFRKYTNNRRPGPACSRNNNFQGNKQWPKDHRRDNFNNNRDCQQPFEPFESLSGPYNNNNNRPLPPADDFSDRPPEPEPEDVPKFKSLVEHLKAVQNSCKNESGDGPVDPAYAKNATEASKKLLTQLKTMDKDGVKELINNPKQPYKKKVLNIQAREKLREQMRKKLKKLGNESDGSGYQFEVDECIDYERIPETLIAQIGKTMDVDLDGLEDMDISDSIEDKDIEVVKTNLGNDFLMGSEMLLMNGFSLLAETDNDAGLDESIPKIPPLPADRPPSPPPEPVPAPVKPPEEKAIFSSLERPWSPIKRHQMARPTFNDDEWDIESAKNPDPPGLASVAPVVASTPKNKIPVEESQISTVGTQISTIGTHNPTIGTHNPLVETQIPTIATQAPVTSTQVPATSHTPSGSQIPVTTQNSQIRPPSSQNSEASVATSQAPTTSTQNPAKTQSDSVIKNNEKKPVDDEWDIAPEVIASATEEIKAELESGQRANETYGEYRRRLAAENKEDDNSSFNNNNSSNNNSNNNNSSNNNNNNNNNNRQQNQQQNQKFNQNQRRGRDWIDDDRRQGRDNWMSNNRNNRNNNINNINNNNNRQQQNRKSRYDMDRERDRMGQGYRNSSRDTNHSYDSRHMDEVKDGHNYRFQNDTKEPDIDRLNTILNPKPLQFKGSFNKRRRSRSRNRTPVNTSMERDFDEAHLVPVNDARPCYYMLKKVMEIDAEIAKIHEKIHGIDKVISNLQLERVGHQKSQTRLQHDRKVLFDNLMKRAMADTSREKSKSKEPQPATGPAAKTQKIQNVVEPKKRKNEEPQEEPKKKKTEVTKPEVTKPEVQTTSAAEKAAQRQKEREEEEKKQKLAEKKRLKQLRKEREELEKQKLEEKIRAEAIAATTVVKQEKIQVQPQPVKKIKKILFMQNEILQLENWKQQELSVKVQKVPIAKDLVESYKANGSLEISLDDWKHWSRPIKLEKNVDPLEHLESPPTPGSNLEDSTDYSEWTGNFTAHEKPIVHLQNIAGKFIVAACEDGKVCKFHIQDGTLANVFDKHTEICNSFLYDDSGVIYTVSSDGFLHKIKFKTFQLIASENFHEALQVIEKSKAGIFVGTKSGKIFKIDSDLTEHDKTPICDVGALILCMRATKEGARSILLVSSRANAIQVRDASSGLLLRTLSDDLAKISIYDMLIEGSTIYCGSNRHEIFSVDFTTGALIKSRPCGAGAICVRLYKNYLIAACYDGNIYIFNLQNEDDAVNICGPSNMLLAMDLWDNKIIASTKDKTLKIMSIPT